jgi:hypothetical protein
MPLHTFGELLRATDALKTLTARVRRLSELQSLYVRTAPRELASSSRVKGCRAGMLFVVADNAAVAAKLKQLAPRLLAAIRASEAEINQIRIEVQVTGREAIRVYTPREKALPASAIRRFGELAEAVADGGLKAAISRLAARHASALDEDQPLQHEKQHRHDHHDKGELDGAPRPREIPPVARVEVQADAERYRKQRKNSDES